MRISVLPFAILMLAPVACAQTKLSGTSRCGKPDQQHLLQVGDRPGHSLSVVQGRCTWTKPMEIAGTQTKGDQTTLSVEGQGNKANSQGYVVGMMANGDKFFVRVQGSAALKDGAVDTEEGKWNFLGGSGNLKGIKGAGTYQGKGGPEGTTFEVEGEYQLPAK